MNTKLRVHRCMVVMAFALLQAGCALTAEQKAELDATFQVKADSALFKGEPVAPESRLPLRMALFVSPAVTGVSATLPLTPGAWIRGKKESPVVWRLQAASIAEKALLKALGEALQEGVKPVPSMPPGDGFAGTLELVSVQFDDDERMLTLVPLLVPVVGGTMVGEFEATMRLSLQINLFDAQARQVWTKNFDDGARKAVWAYPADSTWLPGVRQVAHEAAWRLSQQVLQQPRDWQAAERVKPRSM
jgi:hypothetical protein